MKAKEVRRVSFVYHVHDFATGVVWEVPFPVPPSEHSFKYRLAYIVDGVRVIGFDNERGKGDHRHDCEVENAYEFRGVDQLIEDFVSAVETWRFANGKT